jgi:RimJ/RimL family protein N-acetyltransferase
MVLRRLTEDDADNLFDLDSDPAVMEFLTGGVASAREFIVEKALPRFLEYYGRHDDFGFWAAIEKASDNFMGWFHFRPYKENPEDAELGYRLKKAYWGHGYATEGSTALIEKGFRVLGVPKVVATTMSVNVRSRRVMEKVGLRFEAEFVYPGDPFPGWRAEDCMEVRYGLTQEQWLSNVI